MSSSEYFFSYSRKDLEFVRKLKADLEKAGINVWLDVENLRPGYDWATDIQHALEASRCMLLVLSQTSTASENVLDEISYALDEKKLIIPLRIDDCQVPFRIARRQRIEFSTDYESGLSQLLKALEPPVELPRTRAIQPAVTTSNIITENPEHEGPEPVSPARKKYGPATLAAAATLLIVTILVYIFLLKDKKNDNPSTAKQLDSLSHNSKIDTSKTPAVIDTPNVSSSVNHDKPASGTGRLPLNTIRPGKARVYLTYTSANAEEVLPLVKGLQQKEYLVTSTAVSNSSRVKEFTISYYFDEDKEEAASLLASLYDNNTVPHIGKMVRIRNNTNVRKRHYDVRLINLF